MPEDWIIGWHILTYTDGTEASLPIIYGYNIRSSGLDTESDRETIASAESKTTDYVEAIGASNPVVLDGKLWYRTAYRNPYPQKQILKIRCRAKDGIIIETQYPI